MPCPRSTHPIPKTIKRESTANENQAEFSAFVVVVDNRLIVGVKRLDAVGNGLFVVVRSAA